MSITEYILIVPITITAIVWIVYDILVYQWLRPNLGIPTITQVVIDRSKQYPAIPFLTGLILGLILGHLFLQF